MPDANGTGRRAGDPNPQAVKSTPEERRLLRAERQARAAERLAERLRKLVDPSADLLAAQQRNYRKDYDSSSGRRMIHLADRLPRPAVLPLLLDGAQVDELSDGVGSAGASPTRSHASSYKSLPAPIGGEGAIAETRLLQHLRAHTGGSDADADGGDDASDTDGEVQRRALRAARRQSVSSHASSVKSLIHIVPAGAASRPAASNSADGPAPLVLVNNSAAADLHDAVLPFDHARAGEEQRGSRRPNRAHAWRTPRGVAQRSPRRRGVVWDSEQSENSVAEDTTDFVTSAGELTAESEGDDALSSTRLTARRLRAENAVAPRMPLVGAEEASAIAPTIAQSASLPLMVHAISVKKLAAATAAAGGGEAATLGPMAASAAGVHMAGAPGLRISAQQLVLSPLIAAPRSLRLQPSVEWATDLVGPAPPLQSSTSAPALPPLLLVAGAGSQTARSARGASTVERVQAIRALRAAQLADLTALRVQHGQQYALRRQERKLREGDVAAAFGSRRFGSAPRAAGSVTGAAPVFARDATGRLYALQEAAPAPLVVQGSQSARAVLSSSIQSSRSEGQLPLLVAPPMPGQQQQQQQPPWPLDPSNQRAALPPSDTDGEEDSSFAGVSLMAATAARRRQLRLQQRAAVQAEVAKLVVSTSASLPSLQHAFGQQAQLQSLQPLVLEPPLRGPMAGAAPVVVPRQAVSAEQLSLLPTLGPSVVAPQPAAQWLTAAMPPRPLYQLAFDSQAASKGPFFSPSAQRRQLQRRMQEQRHQLRRLQGRGFWQAAEPTRWNRDLTYL